MDETTGILVALAVGVVLVATLFFLVVPEPTHRVVIASERLDVGILAFGNSSSWPGVEGTLGSRIEQELVNAAGVRVYSRAQIDALLLEQTLGEAGFLDPTTAVEIGSLAGVNKLITGTVYAVDTQSEETTLCLVWEAGRCVEEVPATKHSTRIRAQVEVIDTLTGLIERSLDLSGSDATTLREGVLFGGYDSLLANAATQIGDDVLSAITIAYTRELRYGLYEDVEAKRSGLVGKEPSNRFAKTGTGIHLIVHFTRIRDRDNFDVRWLASDGQAFEQIEDVVSDNAWRQYTLDPADLDPGRYRVQAFISGVLAFDEPFTITP